MGEKYQETAIKYEKQMLGNIYGLRKMLNDSSKINTKWTSWKFKYKRLLEKKNPIVEYVYVLLTSFSSISFSLWVLPVCVCW